MTLERNNSWGLKSLGNSTQFGFHTFCSRLFDGPRPAPLKECLHTMVMWGMKSSKAGAGRDDCSTSSSILVRQPNSPKKRSKGKMKRRHSVDFAVSTDVVEFESADENSKDQMWYTKEEFSLIKERNSLVNSCKRHSISFHLTLPGMVFFCRLFE